MFVGNLLVRGTLIGLLAGIPSFCFLKTFGEPQVDRAITFETAMDEAKAKAKHDELVAKGLPAPAEAEEPELVSRPTQAGIGLFTGVTVYNVAFGGLFALVYALAYGRMGPFSQRTTAALLALSGIISVYIVPNLKYPANPPSVGDPDTITLRTKIYFAMIALSLASMIGAWMLRNRLVRPLGEWNAALVGAAAYVVAAIVISAALPGINEVPENFPAVVLWKFRIASLGAQSIMWATIGLGFGLLTERALTRSGARLRTV